MSRVADPKAKILLLRAAEEVFAERGLASAKVEEIARRAGLSKGAFYLHFESKEAALKQVVESFLARCGAFFAPPSAYADLPRDPGELLDYCLERDVQIFEFLWQSRAILRILPSCSGQYGYLVQAFRAEMAQKIREWVDYWRREELFRDEIDPELAAVMMNGAYHELVERMLVEGAAPPLGRWLAFAQATFVRAFGSAVLAEALEARNGRVSFDIGAQDARPGPADRARRLRTERGRV